MAEKIPATVITGFLGAGKTSIIRHLLENAAGKRIALIINEFGDIGVDGEILKGCGIEGCEDDNILELANGCICCTVADDFVPTMEALLGREQLPDQIVIETSGLAMPKPLVKAFNWPDIRTRVTVDAVVTVVDGPAVADGLFATDPDAVQAQRVADEALDHESPLEELFEEQLSCADMVIINKSDLLNAKTLDDVTREVGEQLRPSVKMVKASHGAVDPTVLLGLNAAAEDDLDSRPSHHDGVDDHDHDDFDSFSMDVVEGLSVDELLARLSRAITEHGVLRVKGFANISGKDMRLLIQAVGNRIQHYYDRDWRGDELRRTSLVVIGQKGLDEQAVIGILNA
ncbi:MAG: cobalamin biosynthesis protein CobW [Thiotrichales bacterium]|nr:cobalamin biosynthesis protein CobW [Thiotrichales bacterium]